MKIETNNFWRMFLISWLAFALGYAAGARTYHPVYLVEYITSNTTIQDCINQKGVYTNNGDTQTCIKTETTTLFNQPLNSAYFHAK